MGKLRLLVERHSRIDGSAKSGSDCILANRGPVILEQRITKLYAMGRSSEKHTWWDNMLSYSTQKMVVVRDYKLGGLYYTLLIAIFVYIIWNMISTGSYLDKSPPISGIVKTSAQLPDNLPVPEYCTPGPFNRNGCIFWSADQIVYPLTGDSNGIFITTRVSISTSYPDAQCNFTTPTNSQCKLGKFEDKQVFYVANVEDITIRVDHAVVTQSSMGFGNNNLRTVASLNMNGRLLKGCSGDKDQYLLTFNEDYRKNANKTFGTMLDVFRFDQLMSAGHCSKSAFSFAKVSEADGSKPGESMRSAGFVVSVPIVYLNRQSAQNLEEITYNYVPAKSICT